MFFDMPRVRTRDADVSTSLTRSEMAARKTASTVWSDQTLGLRFVSRVVVSLTSNFYVWEGGGNGLYMGEAIFASAGILGIKGVFGFNKMIRHSHRLGY